MKTIEFLYINKINIVDVVFIWVYKFGSKVWTLVSS